MSARLRAPRAAGGVALLTAVLVAAAIAFTALAGSEGAEIWEVALAVLAVTASTAVGLLIAVRRRGHAIGWLLLANGALLASWAAVDSFARYTLLAEPGALPGGPWAVLWADGSWPLMLVLLTAMALHFPGGELEHPRERRVLQTSLVAGAALMLLGFMAPEDFTAPFDAVDRPVPTVPEAATILFPVLLLGVLLALVQSVRILRRRFVAARGIERQQLRWVAYVSVLIPVFMLVAPASQVLGFGEISDTDAFNALVAFMFGVVPAAIGLAILRYRLYEIDRIVKRTVVYTVLTALLAGTYGLSVLLLQLVLSPSSDLAVAGSTLAVAAAIGPARRRIQAVVDQRFFRGEYDARATLDAFAARLRSEVAIDAIQGELRDVVGEALQPAHASVWLRPR